MAGVVLVKEDAHALPAADRKRRQEPDRAAEGRDGGHRPGARPLRPGIAGDRQDGAGRAPAAGQRR